MKFYMRLHSILSITLLAGVLAGTPNLRANDWPQWRGPNRDDVSRETGLLQSWPDGGPKRAWLFDNAGKGYSGPAIMDGKYYTLGTRDNRECILALDANTGRELWTAAIGDILDNRWGDGPRGTPAVDGERVYGLSGRGNLVCADVRNGKILWQQRMTDLGGEVPGWGYTESPLLDGDKIVCTPGGDQGAIAAFDKKTGRKLWQSVQFTDDAQYASLVPATIHGVPQYLQLTMNHVAGVSAEDGKLLWQSNWPGETAVIPTPINKDNFVYVTAGYGVGCKLVEIKSGQKAEEVYANRVMKNHHGGVIRLGDHVYGHSDGVGWTCQDFMSGEEVWSEKRALGKGAIGYADGRFYCLEESTGKVVLIEASPQGWKEHGNFTLEPQSEIRSSSGRIWTHPVISNGKLFLRDQNYIYCYEVKDS